MTTRDIKAGGAYIEISARDDKALRSLTAVSNRLKAFGSMSQNIGRQMMVGGAIAAAGLAPVVSTLSNFQDKMSAVAAVSGATGDDLTALEAKARELGATTSFSASQVAEAMQFLGMAGFSTEQILASIPDVLNLARAGAVDLGTAADIASDVGQAFGLSADEISRVADVMAKTASSSNTSIFTLGETFKYAAPLAAAAGQSIESTAAATGLLGNNGVKATMAGTDLALIMKKLAESDLQKTLAAMGVETITADGRIRDLVDIMADLDGALAGMGQAERLNWMASNFDRAAKSAQILTSQNGQLRTLAGQIDNASGSAADMAATMDDNVGGRLRALMSALEGTMIDLGESLLPVLEPIIADATEWLGVMAEWIGNNQELVQEIANLVVLGIEFGAGLYALGTAAGVASSVIAAASLNVTALGTASGVAAVSAGSLSLAIGGLVALAAAASVAVYNHSEAIEEYNAAMERSAELNGQLAARQRDAYQATLERINGITDLAAREKALNEEIERQNKEVAGMQAAVSGAEAEVARLNTTWNSLTGNKLLAEANSELDNHTDRLKTARENVTELYEARQKLRDQIDQGLTEDPAATQTAASVDPEAAAAAATNHAERDAFARTIADMTATPIEQFEEFVDKLNEALDRGDINEEQYNRALGQKQDETRRALEAEQEADPLKQTAESIKLQTETPLERFEQRMREANEALAAGLIDQETANRFREAELKNLDRDLAVGESAERAGNKTNTAADLRSGSGVAALAEAVYQPGGSAEEKNGQKLQSINQQLVQSNQALAQVIRELRDSQIVKESKLSGGGASA